MEFSDFAKFSTWAIDTGAMEVLCAAIRKTVTHDQIQAAQMALSSADTYKPNLTVTRDVAVIPLTGTITRRTTFLSSLFGGASLSRFMADLNAALEDRRIKGIVLYVDSPGGPVTMVPETADAIFRARSVKPIVSYSPGGIMSGAYWIGAAASQIVISPVAKAGSIGVLAMHVDYSKMNEMDGVAYTYITAGKYKAEGNPDEPLSDPARRRIERNLNETYGVFLSAVGRFRSLPEDDVRQMAEGLQFVGQRAVDNNMVDRLGTLDDAIDLAGSGDAAAFYKSQEEKETAMSQNEIKTVEQLSATYPDLCRQVAETAAAGVDMETPRTEAVLTETDRILALAKVHFGDEATEKFEGIVRGGISADQYKAMADALAAPETAGEDPDGDFKQKVLDGINNAGATDVGAGNAGGKDTDDFMAMVKSIKDEEQCTLSVAMSRAAKKHPDLHKAYIEKANQTA
ncbi:MAG: signal peptide peptidase SppA [Thermodesulfobacteriota bacterium]|nr:signal peptide peptidase SppA [Thermodesulfobacteriota bacterium]